MPKLKNVAVSVTPVWSMVAKPLRAAVMVTLTPAPSQSCAQRLTTSDPSPPNR